MMINLAREREKRDLEREREKAKGARSGFEKRCARERKENRSFLSPSPLSFRNLDLWEGEMCIASSLFFRESKVDVYIYINSIYIFN